MRATSMTIACSLLLLLAGCSAEDKICRRMEKLCGTDASECRASVADLRSALGDEAMEELEQCYAEADSCAEAKGCEAALSIKGAASAVGDFLDSFGEKMSEEEKKD